MKNDLSKLKVGDWFWNTVVGYEKVQVFNRCPDYPIKGENSKVYFSLDGKRIKEDKFPVAFTEAPDFYNDGHKPSKFTKGQKVLVRDEEEYECGDDVGWERAYFSHMEGDEFHTFAYGADEWSNEGNATIGWVYCKPWEE